MAEVFIKFSDDLISRHLLVYLYGTRLHRAPNMLRRALR